MDIVCDGHPQVEGISRGIRLTVREPEVLPEPVLAGASDADARAASIYGSVLHDGGVYRMWYQAWPRDQGKTDANTVGYAESDDGLTWRRPELGLVTCCDSTKNNLTTLPFHAPSVFIDPTAPADARYRAFGHARANLARERFGLDIAADGYYTAHSADGLNWTLDTDAPIYPYADVITSAWDPHAGCARVVMKHNMPVNGMLRRCFYTAEWRDGALSDPVPTFVPDELDDAAAQRAGWLSGDYYGVGIQPSAGSEVAFLWNFRHMPPLGWSEHRLWTYGSRGPVDLSLVYRPSRGAAWRHLPGRPNWLAAAGMPAWGSGCLYTASSPIDAGDETWLYITGTPELHGWFGDGRNTTEERAKLTGEGGFARIGLAKWPRNRLIGFEARLRAEVHLGTLPEDDGALLLTLNAEVRPGGGIRAQVMDAGYQPLEGFAFDDCEAMTASGLDHAMTWRGGDRVPAAVAPGAKRIVALELENATLYAFGLRGGKGGTPR